MILNRKMRASFSADSALFDKLNVLDIYKRDSFHITRFLFSYTHNILPTSFLRLFVQSNAIH